MFRMCSYIILLLLVSGSVSGEESPGKGEKVVSGMSIVGNDEAPKSLAIVPWKGSELGETFDISKVLDSGRGPVDKEVFMRELNYYQIMAGGR